MTVRDFELDHVTVAVCALRSPQTKWQMIRMILFGPQRIGVHVRSASLSTSSLHHVARRCFDRLPTSIPGHSLITLAIRAYDGSPDIPEENILFAEEIEGIDLDRDAMQRLRESVMDRAIKHLMANGYLSALVRE